MGNGEYSDMIAIASKYCEIASEFDLENAKVLILTVQLNGNPKSVYDENVIVNVNESIRTAFIPKLKPINQITRHNTS